MKNNMRIQLVPNLKLEQKQKYNSTQEKYLKILSSSYEELHQYILDKASTNPLIEYNSSLDPDLLLEFDDYSKPQLRDVLFEQLHLSNEKYDEDVCDYLISCLDSNGYFKYSKDEVIK